VGGWLDGWMDGWVDGWMARWPHEYRMEVSVFSSDDTAKPLIRHWT